MTQKEAKELTLELWRYLAEHPECYKKDMVPMRIYAKIRGLLCRCPLCAMFIGRDTCEECPLDKAGESCKKYGNNAWDKWFYSPRCDRADRKESAELIVKIVSAWEPEEE
jgi:hypothetical protein